MGTRWVVVSVLLAALLFPELAAAQAKVGTTVGQYLKIGTSARAVGMAEAFVAIANDASSMFYNPGGLARLKGAEILANHTELPADINHEFVAFAYPLRGFGGHLGVFFSALTMSDMQRTIPYGLENHWDGTYFSSTAYLGGISYSRYLTDKFSTGVSIKVVREVLDNEDPEDGRATAVAGDVGTIYDTGFKSIKVGMCINNFGPDLAYIKERTVRRYVGIDTLTQEPLYDDVLIRGESFPLPMNFRVGISFEPLSTPPHYMVVGMEGQHPNDNEERFMFGAEYTFKDFVSLRGGLKTNYDTETWSVGAGCKIPVGSSRLKIDYAYTDWGWLDRLQRVTIGMTF
jgi:hypothetical protein